jgi:TonB family protein
MAEGNAAYPELALRKNESGRVLLRCAIDASGGLTSCAVTDEAPRNEGFGAAALALARFFKADPISARRHLQVVVPIKFANFDHADTEAESHTLCARMSDPEASIKGCTAIIQSDDAFRSEKAGAYMQRGFAHKRMGELQQAIADLTDSIALSTAIDDRLNLAFEYGNRGQIYEISGLYQQAIADFNMALAILPDAVFCYQFRGVGYEQMGRHDEAIADFSRAITIQPGNEYLYLDRAMSYQAKGFLDQAIADYTTVITLSAQTVARHPNFVPPLAKAYNGLAWGYHSMGEDVLALPYAEKAVLAAPQDANAVETRAEVYERLGRRDDAVASYRAALKLQPNMREAQDGLRRLGAAA